MILLSTINFKSRRLLIYEEPIKDVQVKSAYDMASRPSPALPRTGSSTRIHTSSKREAILEGKGRRHNRNKEGRQPPDRGMAPSFETERFSSHDDTSAEIAGRRRLHPDLYLEGWSRVTKKLMYINGMRMDNLLE